MAENPLLPDDELRALLALTKRCAKLGAAAVPKHGLATARKRKGALLPSREALLAGTALQLKPGDLLLPEATDSIASSLAPMPAGPSEVAFPLVPELGKSSSSRLLLGAAMAAALRAAGTDRIVLSYGRAGAPDSEWATALGWAQAHLLPFVFAFADPRGAKAFRPSTGEGEGAPTWEAVESLARRLKMPILSVDGEDAVAVYRVMQESVIRARAGGGPAILWAMLPSGRDLAAGRPADATPVARLQRYLRARKISLRSLSAASDEPH